MQTCYVQSPAYPGVYPRNLKCNYWLNTKNQFIKLYIQNEEFNVDGQRCENIITCPMRPITSGACHLPIYELWAPKPILEYYGILYLFNAYKSITSQIKYKLYINNLFYEKTLF